jgi:hypothetical protein
MINFFTLLGTSCFRTAKPVNVANRGSLSGQRTFRSEKQLEGGSSSSASHMMIRKPTRNKVPRIPKLVVLLLCQRGLEV